MLGLARQGGMEDGGIGIKAPHGSEMAFGQPNGGEAMRVGEAGGFDDRAIFVVRRFALIAAEKHEAEGDRRGWSWRACGCLPDKRQALAFRRRRQRFTPAGGDGFGGGPKAMTAMIADEHAESRGKGSGDHWCSRINSCG